MADVLVDGDFLYVVGKKLVYGATFKDKDNYISVKTNSIEISGNIIVDGRFIITVSETECRPSIIGDGSLVLLHSPRYNDVNYSVDKCEEKVCFISTDTGTVRVILI